MKLSRLTIATILGTSAFLSACRATAPGAAAPIDLELAITPATAWTKQQPASASDQERLPSQFWKELHSETLNKLVTEGLAANPSLATASLRVTSAAAFLEAAAGAGDPKLQASLNTARARVNFVGLPIPGSGSVTTSTTSSLSLGLGVSWEVDLWGRIAAAERGAAANLDASSLDLVAARQSIAAQIAKLSINLAQANANLQLSIEAVQIAQAGIDAAVSLARAGIDTSAAKLSAEANLSRAMASQRATARQLGQVEPALLALVGRAAGQNTRLAPNELADLTADLARENQGTLDPINAGLPADLIARRPDVAAAEARIRAAQAGAEIARANLYPALSLSAGAGTTGSELKNLLDGDFRVWSLGAGLVAPLLNGGALRAAEDQAIAQRDIALQVFVGTALLAFAEVEQALNSEANIGRELFHQRRAAKRQAELVNLLQDKHSRGTASTSEVLSARAAVVQAKQVSLAAHSALLLNRIDLFLALGGGFEVTLN